MSVSAPPRMLPGDMAAGRLSDDERSTILALLRGGSSYGEIRKATGRSDGTIAKIAKAHGVSSEHSVAARTQAARRARSAYSAEVRAENAAAAEQELRQLIDTLHDPRPQVVPGKGVVEAKPTAKDLRDLAGAAESLHRIVAGVHRMDSRAEESPSKGLLERLVESLEEAD